MYLKKGKRRGIFFLCKLPYLYYYNKTSFFFLNVPHQHHLPLPFSRFASQAYHYTFPSIKRRLCTGDHRHLYSLEAPNMSKCWILLLRMQVECQSGWQPNSLPQLAKLNFIWMCMLIIVKHLDKLELSARPGFYHVLRSLGKNQ